MVIDTIVCIISKEKSRFAPYVWISSYRIKNLGDIPCAVVCRPVGMLRICLWCDHPRDLRQSAVRNVVSKNVKERSSGGDVGARLCSVVKRSPWLSVLVLMEVEKRVVSVIADIGVAGKTPGSSCG